MGLMFRVISLVLKICGVVILMILQESSASGNEFSPSPAIFDPVSPTTEETPEYAPYWKQLSRNTPSPARQSNGFSFHSPLVLPPLKLAAVPEPTKGLAPSLSLVTPLFPPNNSAAAPITFRGIVPSLQPTASPKKSPHLERPGLVPEAPVTVPVVTPPRKAPEHPPAIHPVRPGSVAPSPQQIKTPDNKVPLSMPIIPVHIAPPPWEILRKPPNSQPIVSEEPPSILSVPAASPPHNLVRYPLPIHPTEPEVPPSCLPEHEVSPALSPSPNFNWERDGMPVAAPLNVIPKRALPLDRSPAEAPTKSSVKDSANAPQPLSVIKSLPHPVLHPPTPLPSTPFYRRHHPRKNITSPAPLSYLVHPPASTDKEPDVSPISTPPQSFNWKRDGVPIVAPSNGIPKEEGLYPPRPLPSTPLYRHHHPRNITSPAPSTYLVHPPASTDKEPDISPTATPLSSKRKWDGVTDAAPSNRTPKQLSHLDHSPSEAPMQNSPRDFAGSPQPLSVIKSPQDERLLPPTPSHLTSDMHRHAKKNIHSPTPSFYLVPLAATNKGPLSSLSPSYPPTLDPKSQQKRHAPSNLNPESPLSPASSARASPSQQTRIPFLIPKISPSGSSSPRNPEMPYLPHIQALPPPPPNEDCTSLSCSEPFTNSPPGSPCGCLLPMQVGLRLSVALYTFFPLVSEFANEIAAGVFMKQSQVRVMGANEASQDPDKTIVLIDLVPLGGTFDNSRAYLIYERFWQKQVVIKAYYFGDYEVLYVRYPGLPASPTSSSFDGEAYSGHGNNGIPLKPLGVDVRRRQHKEGLKGSIIAVIVLSASIAVILCCAVIWVLLFRNRNSNSPRDITPTSIPSLAKSSGIAASAIGSGQSFVSQSYDSSISPYTGTAKTFSFNDIERATDGFDDSRILGEGGFGLVYSGVLEDGTKVAVKVLKRDDQQGGREFLAEVEMLSRLHHRNLVKLIGICTEDRARCLVYELIPNGSVESHLHGVDREVAPLDWGARLKIALGAARGLAYLHEDSSPRVIHRDFKSSNILLEHDFTPKVSDFGLARIGYDEENRHISTRVMGTFGYVAPEYAMTGHLLVKSDVYSYGVVLLELLTGRKPVDMSQPGHENLVTWARPLLTSEGGLELMTDQSLGPNFPFNNISKVAAIASMCVQPEVSHRPFMSEVVQALKLVCSESEATKHLGSRSGSQENISLDVDAEISNNSGHLPDPLQVHSPVSDYVSAFDVERGLPESELFSISVRSRSTDSRSFRRYSSSGSLTRGRDLPLWQRMRRLSGGSRSEDGVMFRFWSRSH